MKMNMNMDTVTDTDIDMDMDNRHLDIGIECHTVKPTWKSASRTNFVIVSPYNHPALYRSHTVCTALYLKHCSTRIPSVG